MSATYWRILILLVPVMFSCSRKSSFQLKEEHALQFPLVFSTNQSFVSAGKINFDYELRAKETGDTLLFALRVQNNSKDTIKINPGELQIETQNSYRSDVIWYEQEKLTILPKTTVTLLFKFTPVNNLALFTRINYPGDMDSVYYFNLNCAYKNNRKIMMEDKLKFSLEENAYTRYYNQFAKNKKVSLYQIKNRDEVKSDIEKSGKIINSQSVQISESDLLINGVAIKINFFQIDSALYLKARILNHSETMLVINPEKFIVNKNDKVLNPTILLVRNSVSAKENGFYPIIKGGRLELDCKYPKAGKGEFSLSNQGLIYNESKKVVFPEPLSFISDTLNF